MYLLSKCFVLSSSRYSKYFFKEQERKRIPTEKKMEVAIWMLYNLLPCWIFTIKCGCGIVELQCKKTIYQRPFKKIWRVAEGCSVLQRPGEGVL